MNRALHWFFGSLERARKRKQKTVSALVRGPVSCCYSHPPPIGPRQDSECVVFAYSENALRIMPPRSGQMPPRKPCRHFAAFRPSPPTTLVNLPSASNHCRYRDTFRSHGPAGHENRNKKILEHRSLFSITQRGVGVSVSALRTTTTPTHPRPFAWSRPCPLRGHDAAPCALRPPLQERPEARVMLPFRRCQE